MNVQEMERNKKQQDERDRLDKINDEEIIENSKAVTAPLPVPVTLEEKRADLHKKFGFRLYPVERGGSSLFRSISHQFWLTQDRCDLLRRVAVAQLKLHSDIYKRAFTNKIYAEVLEKCQIRDCQPPLLACHAIADVFQVEFVSLYSYLGNLLIFYKPLDPKSAIRRVFHLSVTKQHIDSEVLHVDSIFLKHVDVHEPLVIPENIKIWMEEHKLTMLEDTRLFPSRSLMRERSDDTRSSRGREDRRSGRADDRSSRGRDDQRSGRADDTSSRGRDDRRSERADDRCSRGRDDRRSGRTDDRSSRGRDDQRSGRADDRNSRGRDDRRSGRADDRSSRGRDDRSSGQDDDRSSRGRDDRRYDMVFDEEIGSNLQRKKQPREGSHRAIDERKQNDYKRKVVGGERRKEHNWRDDDSYSRSGEREEDYKRDERDYRSSRNDDRKRYSDDQNDRKRRRLKDESYNREDYVG